MRICLAHDDRADWRADMPVLIGFADMAQALRAAGHDLVGADEQADLHVQLDMYSEIRTIPRAGRVALWCQHPHVPELYREWTARYDATVFVTDLHGLYRFDDAVWLPNAAASCFRPPDPSVPIAERRYDIVVVGRTDGQLGDLVRLSGQHPEWSVCIDDNLSILHQARLVFNVHAIPHSLNARIFEAVACGRLCLTDHGEGLARLLRPEIDYMEWQDYASLEAHARALLADPARIEAAEARLTERASLHTYAQRALDLVAHMEARCMATR